MFAKFAERVLAAVKGRLPAPDVKKLEGVLITTGQRTSVLARGLLSALSAGGASKKDIERFGKLLEKANTRIERGQKPFSTREREEIERLFRKAYLSQRTTRWFTTHLDALLADEINSSLKKSRKVRLSLPKKKKQKKKKPLKV